MVALLLGLLPAAACSSNHAGPATTASPLPPSPAAVFLIVMENHGPDVLKAAPYLRGLASRYALAGDYHAVAHPSLPNYIALTSGDTWGVVDNQYRPLAVENLGEQLTAAGLEWRAYMDGLTGDCLTDTASYAVRHNPFAYYRGRCPPNVVPMLSFQADLATGRNRFTWLTPDLCHDMHDCAPSAGDAWLAEVVPPILASSAFRQNGILFITFDEDDQGPGNENRVPLVVVAAHLKSHVTNQRYDHYSLLATIEDRLGLPRLGKAAAAASITDLFGGTLP